METLYHKAEIQSIYLKTIILVRDYIWYNPARDTAKNKLKEIAARLNEIVGQLDA